MASYSPSSDGTPPVANGAASSEFEQR